jgi:hypothetical protein
MQARALLLMLMLLCLKCYSHNLSNVWNVMLPTQDHA